MADRPNGHPPYAGYKSGDDTYRVFRRMLERGNPPDDRAALLREAKDAEERWDQVLGEQLIDEF